MPDYRVSPVHGVDDAGRDGSINQPWRTWGYLASRVTTTTGNRYLQDAGSIARENVPNSVVAGSNITIEPYGGSEYATISGAEITSGWTYNPSFGVWENTLTGGWNVSLDGSPLTFVAWDTDIATTAPKMPEYSFTRDRAGTKTYIKAPRSPDGCEVAARRYVFGQWTATTDNLVIRGMNIVGAFRHGIYSQGRNNALIEQCRFAQIGGEYTATFYLGNGVEVYGTCTGVVVRDCVFEDIFDSGLSPQTASTDGIVIADFASLRNVFRRCGYAGYEAAYNGTNQRLSALRVKQNRFEDIGKNCWSGDRGGRAITFSNNASSGTNITSGCVVEGNEVRRAVRGIRVVNTQGGNVFCGNEISDSGFGLVSHQSLNTPGHTDLWTGNLVERCGVGYETEATWPVQALLRNNTFTDCQVAVRNTANANAIVECRNNAVRGAGVAFSVTVGTFSEQRTHVDVGVDPGRTLHPSSVQVDLSQYINPDGSLKTPVMVDGVPMLNPLGNAGTYVEGVRLMGGQRLNPYRPVVGAFPEGRY